MAGISGIGNRPSIDILVDRFLDAKRAPQQLRSKNSKSALNKKLSALSDLKTKLTSLRDTVKDLSDDDSDSTVGERTVESSDSDIVSATASETASRGTNTIVVNQLASRDTAVSKRFTSSSTNLASSNDGQTVAFTIAVGDGDSRTLSIDFDDATETNESVLRRFRDAINDADLDVTASVIRDTTTSHRLTIISDDSGESNALTVSGTGMRDIGIVNGGSGRRSMNGANGGFVLVDSEDLNSQFVMNGIDIIADSNTIDDVLTGVTMTLHKIHTENEAATTLTVSYDGDSIKDSVSKFIDDYNSVLSFLNDKTGRGAGSERGELSDNVTYFQLKLKLRSAAASRITSIESGKAKSLADIGVTAGRDGQLKLSDEDKLTDALDVDASAVFNILDSDGGLKSQIETLTEKYITTGELIDDDKRLTKNRISSLEKRESRDEGLLKTQEASLRKQYAKLQQTLSLLSSQQQLINRYSLGSSNLIQFGSSGTGSSNTLF
jgi:flagellar hook-associated protein 2